MQERGGRAPGSPAPASERGYTFKRFGLRWYDVRKLLTSPDVPLSLADRALLLALWELEGRDDGLVWAAVATLGRMASMSERRARSVLHDLVGRSFVALERERGGRFRPNIYSVRWDRLAASVVKKAEQNDTLSNAVEEGQPEEPEPERVHGASGLRKTDDERVSSAVANPVDSGQKGYPFASETRNESTPDHGFDHGLDHVVITGEGAEGVIQEDPPEPAAPTVAELQAAEGPDRRRGVGAPAGRDDRGAEQAAADRRGQRQEPRRCGLPGRGGARASGRDGGGQAVTPRLAVDGDRVIVTTVKAVVVLTAGEVLELLRHAPDLWAAALRRGKYHRRAEATARRTAGARAAPDGREEEGRWQEAKTR